VEVKRQYDFNLSELYTLREEVRQYKAEAETGKKTKR
jgi:hypothetical protein